MPESKTKKVYRVTYIRVFHVSASDEDEALEKSGPLFGKWDAGNIGVDGPSVELCDPTELEDIELDA